MTIIAILLAFALCHFVRDLGRFRQDRWLRSWVDQAEESLSGLPGWSGVTGFLVLVGLPLLLLLLVVPGARSDESLKVFGYFQSEFFYDRTDFESQRRTSFVLQHLNLLLQKDLADNWSAYINFEFTNSVSVPAAVGYFGLYLCTAE